MIFIAVSHRGDVESHEGYLTTKEARRARNKEHGDDDVSDAPKLSP